MATPKKKTPVANEPAAKKAADAIVSFADAAAFDRWLAKNHDTSPAVMVRLAKKGNADHIAQPEALDVVLCWGWIDSVRRGHDETTFLQRYGRRTRTSPWSQINVAKAEALIAAGRMKPPGLAEIERAKADGRWARAYAGAKAATVPGDFAAALASSPKAKKAFEALTGANRYAFLYRIQSAKKPETRARRIETFVAMLVRGEVFHPKPG
jgi:uncharacterized protein YdeI (YjbR/CyaY-like superfamily)